MKKITFFLFFLTTFAFSLTRTEMYSLEYSNGNRIYSVSGTWNQTFADFQNPSNGCYQTNTRRYTCLENCSVDPNDSRNILCNHTDFEFAWEPCPAGQIVDPNSLLCVNNTPTCATGSHLNPDNNMCEGDYPIAHIEPMDSGGKYIVFQDGAVMFCRPNLECITTDKNGNTIANRYYAGAIPSQISNLKDVGSWLATKAGNFFGTTLQLAGLTLAYTGTGDGMLLYNGNGASSALNLLNPFFSVGAGLLSIGNLLVTDENVIHATPTNQSVLNVDLVDRSTLNATSLSGGASDSSLTQQSYEVDAIQEQWKNAGGTGTFPLLSMSSDAIITYDATNPSTAVINTSDKVTVVETKADNTATVTEIQKQDIANTVNNNTDLTYTQKQISAPSTTNDGKTTQSQTTNNASVSPQTNVPVSTDPRTGLPDIVDYNPRTGLKDGNLYSTATGLAVTSNGTGSAKDGVSPNAAIKANPTGTGSSIDLSGVSSRLDKISNQLTKQNEFNEKLEKVESGAFSHGLPTEYIAYDWTSYKASFDNLKATFDGLKTSTDEVQAIFSQGFTLQLTGGELLTCPYDTSISVNGSDIPVSFDLCKSFAPARPVFYMFFYFLFVISIALFGFKTLLRLV